MIEADDFQRQLKQDPGESPALSNGFSSIWRT